nr:MAG TPA: hypothetical protein [Caudoviricetes sp.]
METKVEKEARVVYKDDMVKIVYTNKSAYHKEGEEDTVHRLQAEKLVKKGVARMARGN